MADDRWKRAAWRRVGWTTLLLVAGAALGAAGGSSWLGTTGWVLVGLALIGYVALAFYEIGLSEDRDRAADRKSPAGAQGPNPAPPARAAPPVRRRRR